jgi:glycerophosphoryl diester phosphodiesterase
MLTLPRLIGHRGAARHAPENTLASIRMAAQQGARWVELDVKLTRDRIPVLMHDETLDRTTNGRGAVRERDFPEIRALDAGQWFSPAFRGTRVPTLAEALDLIVALDLGVNLEIKPCPGRGEETALIALTMAASQWPEGRPPPLVSSFDREAMGAAQRVMPAWPRGLLIDRPSPGWAEDFRQFGCSTIHVNARREDRASIARYRAVGAPVLAYTVNSPAAAREVFGWGVAAVFTDTPAALAPVVATL